MHSINLQKLFDQTKEMILQLKDFLIERWIPDNNQIQDTNTAEITIHWLYFAAFILSKSTMNRNVLIWKENINSAKSLFIHWIFVLDITLGICRVNSCLSFLYAYKWILNSSVSSTLDFKHRIKSSIPAASSRGQIDFSLEL